MVNSKERDEKKEKSLYEEDVIETAVTDDEISLEEEGFMQGYNEAIE